MPGWIGVPMKVETRDRLDVLKKVGQSYDSLINEIVDALPEHTEDDNAIFYICRICGDKFPTLGKCYDHTFTHINRESNPSENEEGKYE